VIKIKLLNQIALSHLKVSHLANICSVQIIMIGDLFVVTLLNSLKIMTQLRFVNVHHLLQLQFLNDKIVPKRWQDHTSINLFSILKDVECVKRGFFDLFIVRLEQVICDPVTLTLFATELNSLQSIRHFLQIRHFAHSSEVILRSLKTSYFV